MICFEDSGDNISDVASERVIWREHATFKFL